jgi:hypothetical protein
VIGWNRIPGLRNAVAGSDGCYLAAFALRAGLFALPEFLGWSCFEGISEGAVSTIAA